MSNELVSWPWLIRGDSEQELQRIPDGFVDALVTDPPAGFEILGRKWDDDKGGRDFWISWMSGILQECRRACKPGAYALVWAIPRTSHWTAQALESAGWTIEGIAAQVCPSGMPKGPLCLSSRIDQMRHDMEQILICTKWMRKVRDAAGVSNADIDRVFNVNGMAAHWCALTRGGQPLIPTLDQVPKLLQMLGLTTDDIPEDVADILIEANTNKREPGKNWDKREVVGMHEKGAGAAQWAVKWEDKRRDKSAKKITIAASEKAKEWQGWSTVLKPTAEHWIIARQPDAPKRSVGRVFYTQKATRADARRDFNNHPTVKHTGLMAQLVDEITSSGSVVLDPFMGSGSTGVACSRMARRFIGIERNPEHFETASRRIAEQGSDPARHVPSYTPKKKAPKRGQVIKTKKRRGSVL